MVVKEALGRWHLLAQPWGRCLLHSKVLLYSTQASFVASAILNFSRPPENVVCHGSSFHQKDGQLIQTKSFTLIQKTWMIFKSSLLWRFYQGRFKNHYTAQLLFISLFCWKFCFKSFLLSVSLWAIMPAWALETQVVQVIRTNEEPFQTILLSFIQFI